MAAGIGQFSAIQSAAQSLGVELTPVGVRDTDEIERGVTAFARFGHGGLIVTAGGTAARRGLIIGLSGPPQAALVTYPYHYYAEDGGLISYGPDTLDPNRRAAKMSTASSRAKSGPTAP